MAKVLEEYPIVIEPLSEVLEVKINDGQSSKWERLTRWRVNPEQAPTLVNNRQAAHVFGNAETMQTGKLALAYDTGGILQGLWSLSPTRGWVVSPVSEEINGTAMRQPSVRHTFADAKSRQKYIDIVQQQLRLLQLGQSPIKNAVLEMFNLLLAAPTPMAIFDVSNAEVRMSTYPLKPNDE